MVVRMEDSGKSYRTASLVTLAVFATIAALYLMKAILIPITLAVFLASLLSPATTFLRRILRLSPTGSAAVLFLLALLLGLYLATLTAEGLVQATASLPGDIARIAGQASRYVSEILRDRPYLRFILPEPGTIDKLGDRNSALLYETLTYGLADLSGWVAQGLIVLILVLFLLAESEMLTPKVVRFFARTPGDAAASERTLKDLTRQIRSFLLARTLINLGLGVVFACFLWIFKVRFPIALGLFAGLTNFVPYVGQLLGGGLASLVTLAQFESVGDTLIVASVYLGLVTIEGYIVTPYVLGKSLDLNGTIILVACLFWGFLWGLVGLILAMPMTACLKLVCQNVPELYRWADLMSRDWQPPPLPRADIDIIDVHSGP
ncbi:AI-2E family transporter [Tundrisphaera lichenicola]|uniref:AI-2E family transporter n=1 Tax=Tundrisphaera lichenicola TaxID=2029860 RepID=UPI003EBEDEBB